jgi:hypothetical protein
MSGVTRRSKAVRSRALKDRARKPTEMYLGNSAQLIDEEGDVTNDGMRDYLANFG